MRRYFEKNYLPHVLAIGVTEAEFWAMNPRRLKIRQEAFRQKQLIDDWLLWRSGLYVKDAVLAAFNGRKCKYPEKAYLQQAEDERIIDGSELTEEEKAAERMKFMRAMGWSGK